MLSLSRKEGQSIIIGEDIVITVLEAGGGWCKLGIAAPPEVSIDREEIRILKDEAARKKESV